MKNENAITVLTFDDRSSYRRDEHYPRLIFLATVLRWAVSGTRVVDSNSFDTQEEIGINDMSIDSTSAFLADHIESGEVPIFSKYSRLLLGSAEKALVVNELRSMDGGEIGGLIDDKGFGYYLDGYKLFQTVMRSSLPTSDDFGKGGVWFRLAWDAPGQWRDAFAQNFNSAKIPDKTIELSEAEADRLISEDVTGEPNNAGPKVAEWIEKVRAIALEYIARHKAADLFPSQDDVCADAEKVTRERKIYGPQGRPLSQSYIQRNAIQGEWWKKNKP